MSLLDNIPLPNVVADVGPGGGLFTNMNAISKAGLENRKQQLANQYYGPKTNAEIAHMISPLSLYGHNAGSLAYINAVSKHPDPNYANAIPNVFNQQQNSSQDGMLQQLINSAKQAFGMQPNNNSFSQIQPQSDMSQNEMAGGQGSSVTNAQGSPVNIPDPTQDTDPAAQLKQSIMAPIDYSKAYTSANTEATTQTAQSNEQFQEAKNFARALPIIKTNTDILKDAYKHASSWVKGPQGGLIPHWATNSPYRDIADKATANLRNQMAPLINNGHLAVKNLDLAGDLKPDFTLTKEGLERISNYGEAVATRGSEFLPLYNQLKAKGLTPAQIELVYSSMNKNHPFFDVKNGKSINEGAHKKYITPKAIEAFKRGEEYNPDQNNRKQNSEVTFLIPNSRNTVHIPANRADEFEKAYPDHIRLGRK